jgi:hypothetical protein
MTGSPDTSVTSSRDRVVDPKKPFEEAWEEWWSSDRLDAFGWAALFLWGAVVVVASYTDLSTDYDWWDGWGVFWVGAGVIVLVEAVVRVLAPAYRAKWGWSLFWGAGFLALGLGELAHSAWYALPLIAIAIVILKDALTRQA